MLIIIGIIVSIGLLLWFWTVPVSKMVRSLKESGSSTFEAYFIVALVMLTAISVIYIFLWIL